MDHTAQNLTAVNQLLEELQDTYRDVPIENQQHVVSTDDFDDMLEDDQSDYIGAAYAWVVRDPEAAAATTESFPMDPGASNRVLFISHAEQIRGDSPEVGKKETNRSRRPRSVRFAKKQTFTVPSQDSGCSVDWNGYRTTTLTTGRRTRCRCFSTRNTPAGTSPSNRASQTVQLGLPNFRRPSECYQQIEPERKPGPRTSNPINSGRFTADIG